MQTNIKFKPFFLALSLLLLFCIQLPDEVLAKLDRQPADAKSAFQDIENWAEYSIPNWNVVIRYPGDWILQPR